MAARSSAAAPSFTNAEGDALDRAEMVKGINAVIAQMGDAGFVDRPSYPGFTLVPFAVYRPILQRG